MGDEKRQPTARELIERQLNEEGADAPDFPGEPPMRRGGPDMGGERRPMRPGASMRGPGGMGMGAPRGDFNPRETALMKDYMLLELVRGQGNFYEAIVNALVQGRELEPGQLQHFIDEVGNIPGLTEQHQQLVQKIQQVIASKQG